MEMPAPGLRSRILVAVLSVLVSCGLLPAAWAGEESSRIPLMTRVRPFDVPAALADCERRSLAESIAGLERLQPAAKVEKVAAANARLIRKLPTPEELYIDGYCSDLFMRAYAPNGFVAVFGASALREDHVIYHVVRELANAWSHSQSSRRYPILTAAGPGLMEAANCGASGAASVADFGSTTSQPRDRPLSLGYATSFGVPASLLPQTRSGSRAWEINVCISNGYIFHSFGMRESEMIDRAVISLVTPGGVGTDWEFFEIVSKIQTRKAPNPGIGSNTAKDNPQLVPLVILVQATTLAATEHDVLARVAGQDYETKFAGQRESLVDYWPSLMRRLNAMLKAGTIQPHDLTLFKCAGTIAEALNLMESYVARRPLEGGQCEGLAQAASSVRP
ncbi:LOG family protein [Piscinibacter sp. XHJ-5]|uniref:LOG family protein n=1 Tax=Piscinibacter sp. XHJ-5 TaxID=3037797 RepID=UPI0024528D07|nr:LOG family protein [Piscinibacter sp. XHJ-5]